MNKTINETNNVKGEKEMNNELLNKLEALGNNNNEMFAFLNQVPALYLEERDYILTGIKDLSCEMKQTKDGKDAYTLWSFEFKVIVDGVEATLSLKCFNKDIVNLTRCFNETYKTRKTTIQTLRHMCDNEVKIPMYGYYPLDRITRLPLPYLNIGFGERKVNLMNDEAIKERENTELV